MSNSHKIDPNILNRNIEFCIDEYVRIYEHRDMLREKWFEGMSIDEIAAKHHISATATKDVIYGEGDPVLLRAGKIKKIIILEE